jgi:hypothetical protein
MGYWLFVLLIIGVPVGMGGSSQLASTATTGHTTQELAQDGPRQEQHPASDTPSR